MAKTRAGDYRRRGRSTDARQGVSRRSYCRPAGPGITTQSRAMVAAEIHRIDAGLERKPYSRPRFADCSARYLAESRFRRSIKVIEWHVRLLNSFVGHLEIDRVHDGTLAPFVADRLAAGVSATTINRSLEIVRTILNRAARFYRDEDGRPWPNVLPPLISMLPETPRQPYPLTWEEQDRLFRHLQLHLRQMVLFAINTGLRDSNLCGLMWQWEVPVPEVGRSIFFFHVTGRSHGRQPLNHFTDRFEGTKGVPDFPRVPTLFFGRARERSPDLETRE